MKKYGRTCKRTKIWALKWKKEHSVDGLNSTPGTFDEKISEIEDRAEEIIQNTKQRNKEMENTKETLIYKGGKMRSSNKLPVGEKTENGKEAVFER